MGDLNQKLADLHDPDFTSGLPPAVYVDFLQETGCEGPAWEWAVKAAAEIDRLTARVAELEAERDRAWEAIRAIVKEYPVAAGTAKGMQPDECGYGSIYRARAALGEEG